MAGLKKPCIDCPFLKGSNFEQSMVYDRALEIAESLQSSQFPCHKTTTAGGAEPGRDQFCAGALGTMENEGTVMNNQMVRICGRLGFIGDPAELEDLDMLYDSLEEWVDSHS
tara:strand:+ start:1181 stop:1516 length:336 start_codon:yes stop_codon:yes gene_type:complete